MNTRIASTSGAYHMGTRYAGVGHVYALPGESPVGFEGFALVIAGFVAGLFIGLWAED